VRVTDHLHEPIELDLPIVADLRRAIMGIREAVDHALVSGAPVNTCAACESPFYFLGPGGFEPAPGERCPRCATADASRHGISLEVPHVEQLLTARRGMLAVASQMVLDREAASMDEAVAELEELEQHPQWLATLALARAVTGNPALAHRATMLVLEESLAVAASHNRVAAAMARHAVMIRPDAVERIVLRLKGEVLYDGVLTAEAGQLLYRTEQEHGRKLLVSCYQKDGKVITRRGERDDPKPKGEDKPYRPDTKLWEPLAEGAKAPAEPEPVVGLRLFMAQANALLAGKG
jgi:hypothetical protein